MKPHNQHRPSAQRGGLFATIIMGSVIAAFVQPAMAEDFAPKKGDLALRAGPGLASFDSSADLQLMGTALPGADVKTDTNYTGTFEVDYFLTRRFSVSLTAGIPPESQIDGSGTLAAVGRLANVRYGLGSLLGKAHFGAGRVQPFVGAGVGYFTAFKIKNVGLADLKVDDSYGPALQIGTDIMLTPKIGVHFSVAKAWMKTDGTGSFLGLPASARITLDPLIVQSGIAFRF
jgi:outer membrane protein